jgi:hypothetical protein
MKRLLPILALAALSTACSSTTDLAKKQNPTAPENLANTSTALPTEEKAFVKAIENFDKESIIAQLGEPAKADDVKIKGTNKIVASIWHYHYVNTDENGKYFETTELDFIEDKVVQVVFLNNDGSEEIKNIGQSYEIPDNKPSH